MPRIRQTTFPALTVAALTAALLLASPATAETRPGNDDARALLEQSREAYQQIEQYRSQVELTIEQQMHGQSRRDSVEMEFAYDRPNDRLLLADKHMRMVAEAGTLRLRLNAHADRHFEADLAEPMTLDALLGRLPTLNQPVVLPNLALLTGEDPLAAITSGQGDSLRVRDAGGTAGPRQLAMQTPMGELTLAIDPETRRLHSAVLDLDTQQLGPMQQDASATLSYRFDSRTGEEAGLEDATFAFDAADSRPVSSLSQLQPDPAEAMIGQAAPSFELGTLDGGSFSMEADAAPVTVLEFWATWCGPCRHALPEAEAVHEWAEEHHEQHVAVHSVNVGESGEVAEPYWEDMGLEMSVLMDGGSEVHRDFGGQGLPYTVIVADGRIHYVQSGYRPGMAETLKQQITDLLEGR